MSLSKYEEIHEEIKTGIGQYLVNRFSVLQFKLALLIDDLITLLTDYGLEDRSIEILILYLVHVKHIISLNEVMSLYF